MSLINDASCRCVRLVPSSAPDGEGGFIVRWSEADAFRAAIVLDKSTEAKIAEAAGLSRRYDVMIADNISLPYHTVFRRASDGAVFRVISDSGDMVSPPSSPLRLRQVSAELWEVPV